MLRMSKVQGCPKPKAFQRACQAMFRQKANIHSRKGIDLDDVRPLLACLPLSCAIWRCTLAGLQEARTACALQQ